MNSSSFTKRESSPSTSPLRGLRVVSDTDASRPPIAFSAAREIVVLPAPDGAERMKIIPRRGAPVLSMNKPIKAAIPLQTRFFRALLDVLHRRAHLFGCALEPYGYPRERRALRLRTHRVDLAVDLLQQELDLLAHRPLAFHQFAQAVQMGPQASHFRGDIGPLGGIGGLLVQPLLVDRQIGD